MGEHRLTKYESLVRETPVSPAGAGGGLTAVGKSVVEDYSEDSGGSWFSCSCGEQFHDESSAQDHIAEYGDDRDRSRTAYVSDEDRHVAGIVFTHSLPEDVDLVLQTLETSEFIRVDQTGANYADVVVKGEGV